MTTPPSRPARREHAAGLPTTHTVVSLDRQSVWRSGILVGTLVAGFLLALWLFAATSHFLFLILSRWRCAAANRFPR